jgi:hypothetical protein
VGAGKYLEGLGLGNEEARRIWTDLEVDVGLIWRWMCDWGGSDEVMLARLDSRKNARSCR